MTPRDIITRAIQAIPGIRFPQAKATVVDGKLHRFDGPANELDRYIDVVRTPAYIRIRKTIRTALANAPQVVTVEMLRDEYLGFPTPRDEHGVIMDIWTFLEKRANGLIITAAPRGEIVGE